MYSTCCSETFGVDCNCFISSFFACSSLSNVSTRCRSDVISLRNSSAKSPPPENFNYL